MRICIFLILAIAILASAAPPEKKASGKSNKANANEKTKSTTGNKTAKQQQQQQNDVDQANNTEANSTAVDQDDQPRQAVADYCYDSSYSFRCRQLSPAEYDLECKIVNVDGDPCFPNLATMIEAAAPLSTISFPIHSQQQAEVAAENVQVAPSIVTADNIETITLQAPFQKIPANAFAALPHLKRIVLESLDGVKAINVDRHAFQNTSAKQLHMIGHNVAYVLAQEVDLSNFQTITFSDVEIDCTANPNNNHNNANNNNAGNNNNNNNNNNNSNSTSNISCQNIFSGLKSVETLNVESIYVNGNEMNANVLQPLSNSLKKLTMDVVFQNANQQNRANQNQGNQNQGGQNQGNQNQTHENDNPAQNASVNAQNVSNAENVSVNAQNATDAQNDSSVVQNQVNVSFPVEVFAQMAHLEELELYLYEQIHGISIRNDTPVPLPVAKSLSRMVLSCRYCNNVSLQRIGQWCPNLRQLTVAAPLEETVLSETCMKQYSKLEELVIYDGNLQGINGAFRSTPALKHLSIKYAAINQMNASSLEGAEDTLESLVVIGTPINQINVSSLKHLTALDVSQNQLRNIDHSMMPEKAQFSELNISYNPIKNIENGFLAGVELKNHVLQLNGLEIESFDMNAVEGIQKLQIVDVTKNLKMKKIQVSNYKKLPQDLQRLVVGRSPYLKLADENGQITKMLTEENITLVVEGNVACSCSMNFMVNLQKDHPELIQVNASRAQCSRQGTDVNNLPESFWKNPTVANFLKVINDEKLGLCKNAGGKKN